MNKPRLSTLLGYLLVGPEVKGLDGGPIWVNSWLPWFEPPVPVQAREVGIVWIYLLNIGDQQVAKEVVDVFVDGHDEIFDMQLSMAWF